MLDWDDLRYALAVARSGSLAGAAAALGVDHSTIFRHLNALEARLGVKLFDRLPAGYRPTAAGEWLIETAERVEAEIIDLDRDVALRALRPRQPDLFGCRVADIDWAAYASSDYMTASGRPESDSELREHRLIGWSEPVRSVKAAAWINEMAPEAVVYRTSSLLNQLAAARSGIGIAVLPCYLGDPEPELVRVLPPVKSLATELWLVTHKALKQTGRVRAFMDFIGEEIRRELPLLVHRHG